MGILNDIMNIQNRVQGSLPTTFGGGIDKVPGQFPNIQQIRSQFQLPRPQQLQSPIGVTPQIPFQSAGQTGGIGQKPGLGDLMARIQQSAFRNPFVSGGFPNFPQQGQQPTFGNPFFNRAKTKGI